MDFLGDRKMRKIVGETYNSSIKQFWCKNCKRSVDVIYKDDKGNSYCVRCVRKVEESSSLK